MYAQLVGLSLTQTLNTETTFFTDGDGTVGIRVTQTHRQFN